MKFKLMEVGEELHLLTSNGDIDIISHAEAHELIYHADMFYAENNTNPQVIKTLETYKGRPLASLEDDNTFIIHDLAFLKRLMFPDEFPYMLAEEFAQKHGRQSRAVRLLCSKNRIPGSSCVGKTWIIPKYAEYPADRRVGYNLPRNYRKKNG